MSVTEQIAYEHLADLRREAAAARRVLAATPARSRSASRADRTDPRAARRAGLWLAAVTHRHAPVGCEA